MRIVLWIAAVLALAALPASAQAPRRVALVVANTNYQGYAPLPNTATDATLVQEALGRAGFQSIEVRPDLGIAALRTALGAFKTQAEGADVALIYFAGHGVEVGGRNWLIPVDAALAADTDLEFQAVDANLLLISAAGARARIVVLDACRENPFAGRMRRTGRLSRDIAPGLAAPSGENARGSFLMYSAAPGELASDGPAGRGSPFARAFQRYFPEPGTELRVAAGKIADAVYAETNQDQLPFTSSSLSGVPVVLVAGAGESVFDPRQAELAYWNSCCVTGATKEDFEDYLAKVASGEFPGAFASIARRRVQALAGASRPPATPPGPAISNPPVSAGTEFADCAAGCPRMVAVPGGSFMMGSPAEEATRASTEGPVHRVAIAAFAVGKFEVTVGEWRACRAAGTCQDIQAPGAGDDQPVVSVTWDEAHAYIAWLARATGKPYRLLTEAEWEYAARAGASGPYGFGAIAPTKAAYNWTTGYAGSPTRADPPQAAVRVGQFPANAFGLYDMHGNVFEWVEDCFRPTYNDAPADGGAVSAASCGQRVLRGGAFYSRAENTRAAFREPKPATWRNAGVGFRVARPLP